jgi:hypothetical protein
MYYATHFPAFTKFLSRKLKNSIGYLYIQGDRKIMQFQKGCGQYHPDLGYTLKPGKFVFTEIEYSNEYQINSLGIRDSEDALIAPEIIFLGDSYTVGWGVNQEETFVKRIEYKTRLKTLNTSVPSYGTVREMIMLRKLDRSQLKCLIIQYCGDDYDENKRFFKNDNRPQIMRAETFNNLANLHSKEKSYYFGKYIHLKINKRMKEWKFNDDKTVDYIDLSEAELFIHILKQNADMLIDLPIIIFEMNGPNQSNYFTNELREKAADKKQPLFINNMIVLDMSQYLQEQHFYVLDGHLTSDGNAIVADVLEQTISRMNIL